MRGNVIQMNTLHLNSVRLNGIGKVQSVSLKGGSTEDPVFPPVEPPVEPEPTPTYTLSASVTNGMVSAKRNGSAVNLPFTANEGDTIVVSVTPNDGYAFEGWNDGNTDNPRTITMNADVALSAQCVEVVVPPAKDYIQFEDAEVERVLIANGVSSDGVGITIEDAEKVTSIGTWFNGNTAIESFDELDYFTGVTSISSNAFNGCANLQKLVFRYAVPPTLGASAFANTSFPIYVPDASLEAYKTATNWNTYADRIHPLSEIEGSPYIQFEDAEVERVLMANGVSSDGIGITKDDAAAVTSISTWFKGNTAITSFDELKYFINVKAISGFAFAGCENLQRVNCENIETMDAQVFTMSGIVELILPKITDLPNSGLVGMKKVTKVVIGASCKKIDPNNIWSWNDKGKVAFILEGTTPPAVSTGNNQPSWYGVTFYVPNDSVDTYKSANGWSSWADKIKPLSELNA